MSVQNRDLSRFGNEMIFLLFLTTSCQACKLYPRIRALWGHLTPPRYPCQSSHFPASDLHDFQFSFLQFLQMVDIFQPPGSCKFFLLNWSQFLKSNFLLFKGVRIASTRMRPSDATVCCLPLLMSLFDLSFSPMGPHGELIIGLTCIKFSCWSPFHLNSSFFNFIINILLFSTLRLFLSPIIIALF